MVFLIFCYTLFFTNILSTTRTRGDDPSFDIGAYEQLAISSAIGP